MKNIKKFDWRALCLLGGETYPINTHNTVINVFPFIIYSVQVYSIFVSFGWKFLPNSDFHSFKMKKSKNELSLTISF